jgi:hypothetical protein
VVAVKDRALEAAPGCGGSLEGVLDELGAHVVGDGPPGEPTGVAVDHGRQVEVRAVGERQVGDVTDVAPVRGIGGEVPLEQIRVLLPRGLGDRGPHPPLLHVATDALGAHHPGDALVVQPLTGWRTVVELGGDPRRPLGAVLGVHGPDPRRELGISPSPLLACRGSLEPGVVGGALDLDERAQSLHRPARAGGGGVVGDELEATHQRVSPAKYLALCG